MNAYGPNNISSITQFPELADVVMIDKHPQPSHDNTTMPAVMQQYYGQITGELTAAYIPAVRARGPLVMFGSQNEWPTKRRTCPPLAGLAIGGHAHCRV